MDVPTIIKRLISMIHKLREIEISYKGKTNLPIINNSKDCVKYALNQWGSSMGVKESFKVIFLNNSNRAKGIYTLSEGTISHTTVDIRILFAVALKTLSTSMIILHNHPSGTLVPSEADKKITSQIKRASKLINIQLLDHIILVPDSNKYYSFADEGFI